MAHFEIKMQTHKLITASVWENGKAVINLFFRKDENGIFSPSNEISSELEVCEKFSLLKEKIKEKFKNKKIIFKKQKQK